MASQFKSVMVTIDGQKMMDIPVIVFSWVVAIPGKTRKAKGCRTRWRFEWSPRVLVNPTGILEDYCFLFVNGFLWIQNQMLF